MNPYYQDDAVTIYHGDQREILPSLSTAGALIVSDPPYGINWKPRVNHQDSPWVDDETPNVADLLVGERHCFWGGNYFTDQLPVSESWLVWIKRPAGFDFDADRRSYSVMEMAWTDFGGKPRMMHHTWDGGMRAGASTNRTFCHPSQKPLEVMQWCVLEGGGDGAVIDPFMGSGTTLLAAKNVGRRSVGIEIEERYCEIAAKRMGQEVLDFGGAA